MNSLLRKLAARLPTGPKRRDAKRALARWHDLRCRWSSKRAGLALCYHAVGDPAGDPERELVPPLGTRTFEAQLRHLRARYRLVRASARPPRWIRPRDDGEVEDDVTAAR